MLIDFKVKSKLIGPETPVDTTADCFWSFIYMGCGETREKCN